MMSRVIGAVLLAAAATAAPQPAQAPAPVHSDAAAVEKGMLDATRGLLYADYKTAREGLDRVEAGCRRLGYDDTPAWPRAMVEQDVGMHDALTRGREYTARGMWEEAAGTMVWVARCCRDCHALRATSANPSGSGSPTPPTGSTP